MLLRPHLPQFLDTDPINLRIALLAQFELLLELLAELPSAALRKEGVFGEQFRTRLIHVGGLTVAAHPHIASSDALHGAVLVVEDLGSAESGVDLDPGLFGAFAQPPADVAQ